MRPGSHAAYQPRGNPVPPAERPGAAPSAEIRGENCVMAGQVGLSGRVKLGNRVILAGQVGIVDQVTMGDGAIATAKAGIHKNVAPGEIVTGVPAIPHKLFLKASAVYNRLPDMYQTLKQLQRRLEGK